MIPKLSVAYVTLDEEDNLPRSLESVADLASEIVVIDSGSVDATREIAENFGAKFFSEEWKGFAEQKNSALDKCNCDFVLFLDADETLDETLRESIAHELKNPRADAYYVRRKTYYLGKLLNYAWRPDEKLRLVARSASPRWEGDFVHEKLFADGQTAKLDGFLIHYSYGDLREHFNKTVEYARLSAEKKFAAGRRSGLIKLFLNPFVAFFKSYVIKGAFLDGTRGFLAASSSAMSAFLRYAFLWEKIRNDK